MPFLPDLPVVLACTRPVASCRQAQAKRADKERDDSGGVQSTPVAGPALRLPRFRRRNSALLRFRPAPCAVLLLLLPMPRSTPYHL